MVWNDMQWYSYSLPFLLMQTFWMDTHWMDPYWWDTCWRYVLVGYVLVGYDCDSCWCTPFEWIRIEWIRIAWIRIGGDTCWTDTYWWDTYCKTCWCKRFERITLHGYVLVGYVLNGYVLVGIRIGGIRFEWICVGYVWCDGYVWDMCGVRYVWDMCGVRYVWDMCGVRYVWDMCGVRYANNLLKNPATKRLSGKNVLEPYMNAIEIDMHHEGVIWVMWSWGAIVPASHSSQEVSPGKLWWVPSGQATQILVSAASWQKHAKMQPYIQKHSKSFMASSKKQDWFIGLECLDVFDIFLSTLSSTPR